MEKLAAHAGPRPRAGRGLAERNDQDAQRVRRVVARAALSNPATPSPTGCGNTVRRREETRRHERQPKPSGGPDERTRAPNGSNTKQYWNDAKSREFEQRFLDELVLRRQSGRSPTLNPLNESSPKSAPTASKPLSVAETLALLDRLRQSVRDAVPRTDELERDFATRSHKLRTQFDQALANERARWAARIRSSEAAAAAAEAGADRSFIRHPQDAHRQALESARKQQAGRNRRRGRQAHVRKPARTAGGRTRPRGGHAEEQREPRRRSSTQLANERAALDQLAARARATSRGYALARPAGSRSAQLRRRWIYQPHGESTPRTASHAARLGPRELTRMQRARAAAVLPVLPALALPAADSARCRFALVPELRRFDFPAVSANVWVHRGRQSGGGLVLYFLGRRLAAPHAQAAAARPRIPPVSWPISARKRRRRASSRKPSASRLAHASTTQMLNDHWKQVRSEARNLAQRVGPTA